MIRRPAEASAGPSGGRLAGSARPFVKVCGITRVEDALSAVAAGVDAVGFVLVPESPRHVREKAAAEIARALPPEIARVGVMVDRTAREARSLVRRIGLTAIQAHGDESPEDCAAYGVPVIKALATGPAFGPKTLEPYRAFPVLLDAAAGNARGGTGRTSDWAAARRAREAGFRVLLAGGLGPGNIRAAVEQVDPVAVDLNSGVESEPGRKDPDRIREALAQLRHLGPPDERNWPW